MDAMLIFLDTEFTDFTQCDVISMVDETDLHYRTKNNIQKSIAHVIIMLFQRI